MNAASDRHSIRTYGRRKGHRLSPRKTRLLKEILPGLRPALGAPPPEPLTGLFGAQVTRVWLEIGFGAGEHLAWQAERNTDTGIIGCEPYINGVAALLARIVGTGLGNVRIHDGDAREVLHWLPDASLDRVFLLHPDPWPKARHAKRRLVSPRTLESLARVMTPGAELRIASDIGDYVRTCLEAVAVSGAFAWLAEDAAGWRERPADWPRTRYEKKALAEGRRACYLRLTRV